MKTVFQGLAAVVIAAIAYLVLWPVPINPVAFTVPEDAGYTGVFAPNDRLAALQFVDLDGRSGPEDAEVGPDGLIYAAVHEGEIIRIEQDGSITSFAQTDGRPLGIEFGPDGTLYVADAYRGLLAVDQAGVVTLLTDKVDGTPILYADDLDVTAQGVVYFSDASTRFGAENNGGTLPASVLDLMEHSANGRVLKYDTATGETTVFATGLTFANGVALNPTEDAVFVVETGDYRIWRMPLNGAQGEVILDNLPGFPDNINPAPDGTFWVGLVSPRNALVDKLSNRPFWRGVIMRLPDAVRPAPTRYGFVARISEGGEILETLQDPSGAYALTTGAVTLPDGRILVTSLTEQKLGILNSQ
ncbi:MAG: SMP-30/gluconolactonase/LRE family protein [Paracoccaceae bacterium]